MQTSARTIRVRAGIACVLALLAAPLAAREEPVARSARSDGAESPPARGPRDDGPRSDERAPRCGPGCCVHGPRGRDANARERGEPARERGDAARQRGEAARQRGERFDRRDERGPDARGPDGPPRGPRAHGRGLPPPPHDGAFPPPPRRHPQRKFDPRDFGPPVREPREFERRGAPRDAREFPPRELDRPRPPRRAPPHIDRVDPKRPAPPTHPGV